MDVSSLMWTLTNISVDDWLLHECSNIFTSVCVNVMHICTYIYTRVRIYTYVYTYIHTYIHMYTHMYIRIYQHSHESCEILLSRCSTCICMSKGVYVCACNHIRIYINWNTYIYKYIYLYTCTYTCIQKWIYISKDTYTYTYIYIYMHIYMHIYT